MRERNITATNYGLQSGSLLLPAFSVEEAKNVKRNEVKEQRKKLLKDKFEHQRLASLELQQKQNRNSAIKEQEVGLKGVYQHKFAEKLDKARELNSRKIHEEISRITQKEKESK